MLEAESVRHHPRQQHAYMTVTALCWRYWQPLGRQLAWQQQQQPEQPFLYEQNTAIELSENYRCRTCVIGDELQLCKLL
jgi:hypothetical protein